MKAGSKCNCYQFNGIHPIVSNHHSYKYRSFHLTQHFYCYFQMLHILIENDLHQAFFYTLKNPGKMLLQTKTFYLKCQDCVEECQIIVFDKKMWRLKVKGKGRAIPVHAWTDTEGSRRLQLPDFMTTGTLCSTKIKRPDILYVLLRQ